MALYNRTATRRMQSTVNYRADVENKENVGNLRFCWAFWYVRRNSQTSRTTLKTLRTPAGITRYDQPPHKGICYHCKAFYRWLQGTIICKKNISLNYFKETSLQNCCHLSFVSFHCFNFAVFSDTGGAQQNMLQCDHMLSKRQRNFVCTKQRSDLRFWKRWLRRLLSFFMWRCNVR